MGKTPGKKAQIKVSGAPLTLTNEATTDDGTHLVYQITNAAKRVLDPQAAVTVKEDGTPSTAAWVVNRLNGTITFKDHDPFLRSVTVGDADWTPVLTPTRTPEAFHRTDGIALDLIGDDNASGTESFTRAIGFTGDASKDFSFCIAKSSAYASHAVTLKDGATVRFDCDIDFTGATPTVAIITAGTVKSVTARGDGSFDVLCTATGVVAADTNTLSVIPANGGASDTAALYIGNFKFYNAVTGPRGGSVAVTVSGSYLPMTAAINCNEWSLALSATNADVTDFDSGGVVARMQTAKDASGSLKGFRDTIDATWENALFAGVPVVLELHTVSSNPPDFLVWGLLSKQQIQSAIKTAATQQVDFEGAPDADNRCVSTP